MKEQNSWINEFKEDDSSVDESFGNLVQCQNGQASTSPANINGASVPKIEVTDASPTAEGPVELMKLAHNHAHAYNHTPDLHKADAAAHPHHHALRHLKLLHRHHEETPIPQFTPKQCQDPYFHTLTIGRQRNISLILFCHLGLALRLRPLLSSLAQAILTSIQNVSVALPFIVVFHSLVSLLVVLWYSAEACWIVLRPGDLVHSTDKSSV
jgi:hypothetical protein